MKQVDIPIRDTRSRKIEKHLYHYPPEAKENETYVTHGDVSILVKKLKGLKPHCFQSKIKIYVSECNERQYQARVTITYGWLKFAALFDDTINFRVAATLGVEKDFVFDIWPLVRGLQKFNGRVHIFVSSNQLIIKQNRDRMAFNFFGVKDA